MKEDFSLDGIRTIIFDMDDLIIKSHAVHMRLFEKVLNKYDASFFNAGDPFTNREEAGLFGMKIIDGFRLFRKRFRLEDRVTAEQMNDDFNAMIIPEYEEGRIEPMPGFFELIDAFKSQNYTLALASASKRRKIDIVLRKLHLQNTFDAIVSGEDEGIVGKPAPDIFLKAAEKIGTKPEECLVFEDAKNGVEAAKAAGMRAIGVHNQFTYQELGIRQNLSRADLQMNNLKEVKNHLFPENK